MVRFFVSLQLFGLGNSSLNSDSSSLDQNEYSASSASSLANAGSSPDASKPGLPGRSLIRMLQDQAGTVTVAGETVALGGEPVTNVATVICEEAGVELGGDCALCMNQSGKCKIGDAVGVCKLEGWKNKCVAVICGENKDGDKLGGDCVYCENASGSTCKIANAVGVCKLEGWKNKCVSNKCAMQKNDVLGYNLWGGFFLPLAICVSAFINLIRAGVSEIYLHMKDGKGSELVEDEPAGDDCAMTVNDIIPTPVYNSRLDIMGKLMAIFFTALINLFMYIPKTLETWLTT